jgi:sirohydrochlorin ferrochelatase
VPRRAEVAERVVQALEAADAAVASLPQRVAGAVLVALGSSPAENEDLARTLAGLFRSGVVSAVEATVTRALLSLGRGPDEE